MSCMTSCAPQAPACLCNDGVCCEALACTDCRACNLTGAVGLCSPVPVNQSCRLQANSICRANAKCLGLPGRNCSTGAECLSASCVDQVCCETLSCPDCQVCNSSAAAGTCSEVPVNQTCRLQTGGLCSASGTCLLLDGRSCALNTSCLSGYCVRGICCNSPCDKLCQTCNQTVRGTCEQAAAGTDPFQQCLGLMLCSGASGCQAPPGTPCSLDAECGGSLRCRDGVCCTSNCTGLCEACNVTGSLGTCTPVAAGTDPRNECPGATVCNSSNTCSTLPLGAACGQDAECSSGFCAGTCCPVACAGPCSSCTTAPSSSSPSPTPASQTISSASPASTDTSIASTGLSATTATPVAPSPSQSTPATTAVVSSTAGGDSETVSAEASKTGVIVGATLGGLAALALIIAVIVVVALKARKQGGKPASNKDKEQEFSATDSGDTDTDSIQSLGSSSASPYVSIGE